MNRRTASTLTAAAALAGLLALPAVVADATPQTAQPPAPATNSTAWAEPLVGVVALPFADDPADTGDLVVVGGAGAPTFGVDGPNFPLPGGELRVRFDGASAVAPAGVAPTGGHYTLATGDAPPASGALYGGVIYEEVWPGVDARYGGSTGALKSEFVVAPGALPSSVRLVYEGATAAVADDGTLQVVSPAGDVLIEDAPIAYQDRPDGTRTAVPAEFEVATQADGDPVVSFAVGAYDATLPLVLDPLLLSSFTYFGSIAVDDRLADVVDVPGTDVVVVGAVPGITSAFAPAGFAAPTPAGADAVVARLDPATSTFRWVTRFGEEGTDEALAVDAIGSGTIVVGGATDSPSLPGNGWVDVNAGGIDGFVARFDPTTGGVLGSSFVGGAGDDRVTAVNATAPGYVAGTTTSPDLPVVAAAQPAPGGGTDGFLAATDGTLPPAFLTYLGGSGTDDVGGIDIGTAEGVTDLVVAGTTTSADLPTAAAVDTTLDGPSDGHVAVYGPDGARRAATYQGGPGVDGLVDVTAAGRAHRIAGWSDGYGVPLGGGGVDVLVARLFPRPLDGGPYGQALRAFRIGGPGDDRATDLSTGTTATVVGRTDSPTLTPLGDVEQSSPGGGIDGFVLQVLTNDPSRLSYFGGQGDDEPMGADGDVVVGRTDSPDIPGRPSADAAGDGFIATYAATGPAATPIAEIPAAITPALTSVDAVDLAPAAPPSVLAATAAAPLRAVDLGASLASTPLRAVPLRAVPLRAVPLRAVLLSSVPTEVGGGWSALLEGTPYEGLPLQSVTLTQVLELPQASDPTHPLGQLSLADLDLAGSPLGSLSLASLAYGELTLDAIPVGDLDQDGDEDFDDWVALLAGLGLDAADLGLDATSTVIAADIAGVPLRAVPLRAVPLRAVDVSALGIAEAPLRAVLLAATPLRAVPLRAVPLRAVFDCSLVDCDNPPDVTLGEFLEGQSETIIRADATLVDLGEYGTATVGDVLLALLDPSAYVFSAATDASALVVAAGADAARVPIRAGFVVPETGSWDIQGTIDLPAGWVADRDSVVVTIDGVPGAGQFAQFTDGPGGSTVVTARSSGQVLNADSEIRIELDAVPPLTLGTTTIGSNVGVVGLGGALTSTGVTVGQDPALESTGPTDAPALVPGRIYAAHLPTGDTDWFAVTVPAGSPVSVDLGPVPVDLDLVVYAPPGGPAADALRDPDPSATPIIPLDPADPTLQEATGPSDPSLLADVPLLPGRTVAATSIRRGRTSETASFTATQTGTYLVQVSGWNGAASPQPYQLRVRTGQVPGADECVAPPAPAAGEDEGTRVLPAAIPPGTESLLLVHTDRLADQHGAAAAGDVLDALDELAAHPAVRGVVVPLDASAAVRSATAAWNVAPCDPDAANAVVRATNDVVDALLDASPEARTTLRSVVLVGDDDQVPFGRIPDGTLLANEAEHATEAVAADGRGTPVSAALARAMVLTDDPYADLGGPAPWGDRWLYLPELAVGRLVETPEEIVAQIDQFVATGGALDPTTAFTSGYDFLTDGAQAVDAGLAATGLATDLLVGEEWTGGELLARLLPTGAPPVGVASINAHFDQTHLLPADGNRDATAAELVGTADLPSSDLARLVGTIAFSMGCHSGLTVADRFAPADADRSLDWAQAFAQQLAVFVGNTGFGYGDTATVAYSEALLAGFAGRLDGTVLVGEALADAKAAYAGGLLATSASEYDRKALAEATFYGLPMYRVGPAAEPPPAPEPLPLVPVGPGLQAAATTVTGAPVPHAGPDGTTFWTNGVEPPLVVDGRPIQPRTTVDVTQPEEEARGVVVESLTSTQVLADVTVSRPVIDRGGDEPPIPSADEAFPGSLAGVATEDGSLGRRQRAVVAMGQFLTDADPATPAGVGVQRLFGEVGLRAYYSHLADVTRPAISRAAGGSTVDGTASFEVDAADPETGIVRAFVLYLDDSGLWQRVELTGAGGTWTGTGPAVGDFVDYLVQVVNGAGMVGTASGKGRLLRASITAPPPDPAPVVDLGPDRAAVTGEPVTFDATVTSANPVTSATVDDGTGIGPIPITVQEGVARVTVAYPDAGAYDVVLEACTATACGRDTATVTVTPAVVPTLTPGPAVTATQGEPATVTATVSPADLTWTATVDGAPATVTTGTVQGPVDTSVVGTRDVVVTACPAGRACLTTTVPLTVVAPPDLFTWEVLDGDPGEVTVSERGTAVELTGSGLRRALATPAPGNPGEVGLTLSIAIPSNGRSGAAAGVLLGDGAYAVELARPSPSKPPVILLRRWGRRGFTTVGEIALPRDLDLAGPLDLTVRVEARQIRVLLDPAVGDTLTRVFNAPSDVVGRAGVVAEGTATATVTGFTTG